ncbi:hypothetical protein DPMN_184539 [Dreissena polymorpha]|uniref:Uncharacterized protein n=1 Tax=Dreissena polymorpha TaxID=45954 RepID=A0A9D4I7I4_DREPO|nr:hypothetical protein DPMN_184539 [Dreissena polymorpha]
MKYNTTLGTTLYNDQASVSCQPGYHLNKTNDKNMTRTQVNADVTENITCIST